MEEFLKSFDQKEEPKKKLLCAPFLYLGSKRRELPIIEKYEPKEFNKVIDAFGGGSSVSLFYEQKRPDCKIIYNDIARGITELLKLFKNEDSLRELIKWFNAQPIDNETFRKYKEDNNNPYNFAYCLCNGFRGCSSANMINTTIINSVNVPRARKLTDDLLKYVPHYQRIEILNKNAIELIEEYRYDKDAFIYLDPPYLQKETFNRSYDRFEMEDIKKIISIINDPKTTAKIMLHIDFSGYTYDKLKEKMKFYYPSNFNICNNDGAKYHKRYQMIACNY